MIATTEINENLEYFGKLKLRRLKDILIENFYAIAAAQQGCCLIVYTIWKNRLWEQEMDDEGKQVYANIGQFLDDFSQEAKEVIGHHTTGLSKQSLWKMISIARIQIGNGVPENEVIDIPLRLLDEARSAIGTFDRQTGEIMELTPEAEENLPLPDSTPRERVAALLRELPHLSQQDQYARVRDIRGQRTIIPAQVNHDPLERTVSFLVVDRDTGEEVAKVRARYETEDGLDFIARAYGVRINE